jgi:hypothetical protein
MYLMFLQPSQQWASEDPLPPPRGEPLLTEQVFPESLKRPPRWPVFSQLLNSTATLSPG